MERKGITSGWRADNTYRLFTKRFQNKFVKSCIGRQQRSCKRCKKAELTYTIFRKEKIDQGYILYVKIDLHTGRHHQIRVQLSHAGIPLLGDLKYGTDLSKQVSQKLCVPDVALCAQTIQLRHPSSKKPLAFTIKPQKQFYKM